MQDYDWNALKDFLALYRTGRMARAAVRRGVNETTIARRIRTLEHSLGVSLFERSGAGLYHLTQAGAQMLDQVEEIEAASLTMQADRSGVSQEVMGTVRLTSVPILIHHVLLPHLHRLRALAPGVTLDLVPAARSFDLTKREADLAVRFSRPAQGGLRVKAQKIGSVSFAVFGAAGCDPAHLPWICYDEDHQNLPQAAWLESVAKASSTPGAGVRVTDADTALYAVLAGLGKSLLPLATRAHPDLRPLDWAAGPPLPQRDIWLLSHAEQRNPRAIEVVKRWLSEMDWNVPADPRG